jgi:hypothetical protein
MEGATHLERVLGAGRTHALFRSVNERVRDLNEAFTFALPVGDWVCECASHDCIDRLYLSLEEYAAVRAVPTRFFVSPGDSHVLSEIEDLIQRTDRFWTVQVRDEVFDLLRADALLPDNDGK